MKALLFFVFLIVFVCISSSTVYGQFNEQKQKYWIYKERLKNFMITTSHETDLGFDIPARRREAATDLLYWSDEPRMIGYYIATLAMEYDLLIKSGLSSNSVEVLQTKKDLFNAINAINRLDWQAEFSYGCSACNDFGYCKNNINGFMMRDDVPETFSSNIDRVDNLNESWVPPKDGYRDKCINSSFEAYYNSGAEMSVDHLSFIYFGLAFVKRYLPENETYLNMSFNDEFGNITTFVKEVQVISHRITTYLVGNQYIYKNICTDNCVFGVYNLSNPNVCFNNPQSILGQNQYICDGGGALGNLVSIGLSKANVYINEGGIYQGLANAYYLSSAVNATNYITWNGALDVFNDKSFPFVLSAIGDIGTFVFAWGFPSPSITPESNENLMSRFCSHAVEFNREYLPLIFNQLHNYSYDNTISQQYYECLLNAAPCRGYDGNLVPTVEWSGQDRIGGDRNHTYSDAFSRLDYMFYFNLIYESYYNSSYDFSPIPINQLALENIHKTSYTEYDKKNFMAANEIIADNYVIANSPVQGIGRVTFVAGEKITLNNGFHVTEGSQFHGFIDGSVGAMTCTEPTITDCSSQLPQDKMAEQIEYFRRKDSITNLMISQYVQTETNNVSVNTEVYLSVVPNPSTGLVAIESSLSNAEINILALTGENVFSSHYSEGKMDIDLSFLESGVYILNIRNNVATKSLKLVIQ